MFEDASSARFVVQDSENTQGLIHRFVANGDPAEVSRLGEDLASPTPPPEVAHFIDGASYFQQRCDTTTVGAATRHASPDVTRIERIAAAYPMLSFEALIVTAAIGDERETLSANFLNGRNTYKWQASSRTAPLVPPVRNQRAKKDHSGGR